MYKLNRARGYARTVFALLLFTSNIIVKLLGDKTGKMITIRHDVVHA
jgi:hypothetical protein